MLCRRQFGSGIVRLDGVRIDASAVGSKKIANLLFKGIYEADERRLLAAICEEGDRVLEIGAGIGVIGLVAARICGAGAVVSYEANPRMREVIEANYRLNPVVPRIVMMPVTLDGGPIAFNLSDDIISSSSLARSDGPTHAVTVMSCAFADALRDHDANVVVMDIEGYEDTLLMQADLSTIAKLLVEFHPHVTGMEAVLRMQDHLRQLGFVEQGRSGNNVAYRRA
jgi:FkbM family methyltransferase